VNAAPIAEVNDLRAGYSAQRPVLCGLNLEVREGELCCVLGRNGCGKTTLLRCLLGLLAPQSGEIRLAGQNAATTSPAQRARIMSYVPQAPRTTFDFTVLEMVLMARYAHAGALGVLSNRDRDIAEAALDMTATRHLEARTLDELSSGEAQRVMIARALAQQPRLLLLDEPTSHLDLEHQVRIHRMMQRLAHDWPMAVLCISHDLNLAARFADRLVLVQKGRVAATGTPTEVMKETLLKEVFGVPIEIISTPGAPMIRVTS
jgi:iron complex transport system ATP-binding protein